MLEYDTKTVDGDYYNLRNGKYIQLVFIGNKGIPFCTIRPARARFPFLLDGEKTNDNYEKYHRNIGEVYKIVIKEVENANNKL